MFEIGNSLREARVRRGLDFNQAELATKIRGKYLRALEDEQFEMLPAETYVKGFLRTYAEYLGLDGQLYVDEYSSRFVSDDHSEARARRSSVRPQRRHRRIETNVVLVALATIVILLVIVISAWKASGGGNTPAVKATPPVVHRPKIVPPLFLVTALRGTTHLTVRRTNARGGIAFDGTVAKGDPARAIRGHRLWVQIDTPENLRIRVRGKLVHVPGHKPQVIIVTPTGWRPA